MKTVIVSVAGSLVVAWLGYTLISPTPCVRVERSAAPVRVVADVARFATKNWLDIENRIMLIEWSMRADLATQKFVSRQFYGDSMMCLKKEVSQ